MSSDLPRPNVSLKVRTLTEYLFWVGGGGGRTKGEACDRRQKVGEEEASKNRRFCRSWRQMREKVSLLQTHRLPLLQRVPAQKLDETRHLRLNTGPTALLAQSECVHVCFESLSSVWCFGQKFRNKPCIYLLQCLFLTTRGKPFSVSLSCMKKVCTDTFKALWTDKKC